MEAANSPSASSIYDEYVSIVDAYESAANIFEADVQAVLSASNIEPAVLASRHKRPLELFKKQRRKRYQDPWAECPDLVGVRVVVPLSSDKIGVVAALKKADEFSSVRVEDQSQNARPELLAYKGLHVHIQKEGLEDPNGRTIRCEVQIRTVAEHSWAMTEHKYVYKKSAHLPPEIQRVFRRLLVLVELYDDELSRGVAQVQMDPGFAEMSLVLALEDHYEKLVGTMGDQDLTRENVELLSGSLGVAPDKLAYTVSGYLENHSGQVLDLFRSHGPSNETFDVTRDWLLSQPEVLLVMALLKTNPYELSSALESSDFYSAVEPIALWTDCTGFVR